MTAAELRDALRATGGDDDEAARARSWRVVRAAYAGRRPRPRRRPWWPAALAAALLAVGAGGAAAAGAPRTGVGHWVRSVLGVEAGVPHARPALVRIPGGGRLLVQAGGSTWIVGAGGDKRRLGAYAGATWSPHGLFVAAWRGGVLTAVDPRGRVRWSLARPAPVSAARWAPVDGFRVAYLSGGALRIVDGDGTGDRRYAAARSVAPAWRPDAAHVLAFVDATGRVTAAAVDAGRRLWRGPRVAHPLALAWSPGGDRLLVLTTRRLVLLDRGGRRVASRELPAGMRATSAAWAPDGRTIALVRHGATAPRSELVRLEATAGLREAVLLTGPGRFGPATWAPDGRRVLLPWGDADQWLFLRARGHGRPLAVGRIARQFSPGAARPVFPRSVAWCCRRAGQSGP